MVARDRIKGETLQILILPETLGVASVRGVMKGPSGPAVTTDATSVATIIGYPWLLGVSGWLPNDFGPVPPTQNYWLLKQSTAAFAPGQWALEIWTTDTNGDKTVLCVVSFSINDTVGAGGTNDQRSTAQKAVAAIESYLADPTNISAASYTINNRSLSRWPLAELRGLLSYWRQRVKYENIRENGKSGIIGRRIEVRF